MAILPATRRMENRHGATMSYGLCFQLCGPEMRFSSPPIAAERRPLKNRHAMQGDVHCNRVSAKRVRAFSQTTRTYAAATAQPFTNGAAYKPEAQKTPVRHHIVHPDRRPRRLRGHAHGRRPPRRRHCQQRQSSERTEKLRPQGLFNLVSNRDHVDRKSRDRDCRPRRLRCHDRDRRPHCRRRCQRPRSLERTEEPRPKSLLQQLAEPSLRSLRRARCDDTVTVGAARPPTPDLLRTPST